MRQLPERKIGRSSERSKRSAGNVWKKDDSFLLMRFIALIKGQQDYLLPFVEDGTLILIGATTENPYFEVNGALISRSSIFELRPLEKADIKELLLRAVNDTEKGLGSFHAVIEDDALEFWQMCQGEMQETH